MNTMMNKANNISANNNHIGTSLNQSQVGSQLHCKRLAALACAALCTWLTACTSTSPEPDKRYAAVRSQHAPSDDEVEALTHYALAARRPASAPFIDYAVPVAGAGHGWQAISLNDLPNWQGDAVLDAWPALQRSCQRLMNAPALRAAWAPLCLQALAATPSSHDAARSLLLQHLVAYVQSDDTGKTMGLATAYFEPIYNASLQRGGAYQWPVFGLPDSQSHLPREQLTPSGGGTHSALQGKELAWFDNAIDPFLAQVQGSLRIRLPDGSVKRLGFAAKNGQPYQSIANTLIRQGVFSSAQASMERIKAWASDKDAWSVQTVLNTNPSFVYFKWLDIPADLGPIGAYTVPLSALRSVAVDTAYTPLGAPIWLDTTTLNGAFQQLMLAQDVGSAIKGVARVDIYMGTGEAAGRLASAQKYPARVWVLWPK
jgi:membrane-bound lytic murein transglycosylase A